MQAYLGDKELKKKTVAAMKGDIKAELLVKGHYWNGTNGCFVGCVIRGNSHADFELKLGVPRILARLSDRIFEGLDYDDAKKFSVDLLDAIPVGADLSGIWDKFAYSMLIDEKFGVINFTKKENIKKVIQAVTDLYKRKIDGEEITLKEWLSARSVIATACADATTACACADATTACAYADATTACAYADATTACAAATTACAYADATTADATACACADATAYAADATAYAATAYADAYAACAYADAIAVAYARTRHFETLAQAFISLLKKAPISGKKAA